MYKKVKGWNRLMIIYYGSNLIIDKKSFEMEKGKKKWGNKIIV